MSFLSAFSFLTIGVIICVAITTAAPLIYQLEVINTSPLLLWMPALASFPQYFSGLSCSACPIFLYSVFWEIRFQKLSILVCYFGLPPEILCVFGSLLPLSCTWNSVRWSITTVYKNTLCIGTSRCKVHPITLNERIDFWLCSIFGLPPILQA